MTDPADMCDLRRAPLAAPMRVPSLAIPVAGWLILAMGFTMAALQLVDVETWLPTVLLESFTPYCAGIVCIAIAIGMLQRRRRLAAAAIALCTVHLVLLGQPNPGLSRAPGTTNRLRVFDQNVAGATNRTPGRIAEAIRGSAADLVLLQEVTPGFLSALEGSGATTRYAYRWFEHGLATYSRRPITNLVLIGHGENRSLRFDLAVGDRSVRVYNIHMPAPLHDSIANWRASYEDLSRDMQETTPTVVLGGDFNATWSHHTFRRLMDQGYAESATALGQGGLCTWPVNDRLSSHLGGVLRIDHMLTRGALPLSIEMGDGNGSDHRATTVELATP